MRMIVSLKYAVMALVVIAGGLAIAAVFETDLHKGPAAVIDADTLQINDTRYRLYGVDAVGDHILYNGSPGYRETWRNLR